jgi:hypothetical protein
MSVKSIENRPSDPDVLNVPLPAEQYGYATMSGRLAIIKASKDDGTRYIAIRVDGEKAPMDSKGRVPVRGAVLDVPANEEFTKLLGMAVMEGDVVDVVVQSYDLAGDFSNDIGLFGHAAFRAVDVLVVSSQLNPRLLPPPPPYQRRMVTTPSPSVCKL